MSTDTATLIGLEELQPEPCDGAGDDVMSNRARNKWHVGVHAGPPTSNDAGLHAADFASFGGWVKNRREHDRQAQFLFALWQQRVRPALPKPRKPLNRDSLASIASKMAEKQMVRSDRANGVVKVCLTNKQFYETVLRQMEACNYASIGWGSAFLDGPHLASRDPFFVDEELFATLCGLGSLVFPEVQFSNGGFAESVPLNLRGIERLDLSDMWCDGSAANHLNQLLLRNKDSLTVLKIDASMLSIIPDGLHLEEFSCRDPDEVKTLQGFMQKKQCPIDRHVLKAASFRSPSLDMKVFSCRYLHKKFSLPLPFICALNVEEVRIEAREIDQPEPVDTLAPKPSSSRVKKLTITLPPIELTNLAQLIRDVAAMCPELECFELVQDSKFDTYGQGRRGVADELAANIRGVMEERSAPFRISLKLNVKFVARSWNNASDFARRLLSEDLPPREDMEKSDEPIRLHREMSDGTRTLRVDCELLVPRRSGTFGISR